MTDTRSLVVDGGIRLWGAIGYPDVPSPLICADAVERALAQIDGPVVVHLNSGGGILGEALKIWALLKQHPAHVTIVIDGRAASAGSIIAMAGDRIVMRVGARLMLHSPQPRMVSRHQVGVDLVAAGLCYRPDATPVLTADMVSVYADRSGQPRQAIEALLAAETWMSGAEAVAMGFADQADILEWRTEVFAVEASNQISIRRAGDAGAGPPAGKKLRSARRTSTPEQAGISQTIRTSK